MNQGIKERRMTQCERNKYKLYLCVIVCSYHFHISMCHLYWSRMRNDWGISISFLWASSKTQFEALKSINLHNKSRWNIISFFDTSTHKYYTYLALDAWMSENVLGIVWIMLQTCEWLELGVNIFGHNNCQKIWNSRMDFQRSFWGY